MSKLRCGLAGCGFIADFHIRSVAKVPGAEVSAICDLNRARAADFAAKWRVGAVYSSLEDMLAGEHLDSVHVLFPPPLHYLAAEKCLKHGVMAFIEKPMTLSAEEGHSIALQTSRTGPRAGVNHNFLFHPAYRGLEDAIHANQLGPVRHVAIHHSSPLRPLSAKAYDLWIFQHWSNIIFEYFPHPLSMVHRLLGEPLQADCLPTSPMKLDGNLFYSQWLVNLICQRGTAQISVSFDPSFADFSIYTAGQDGTAIADLRRNTLQIRTKNRYDPPLDDFAESMRSARSLAKQGIHNLKRSATAIIGGHLDDAFSQSLDGSIKNFYSCSEEENRLSLLDAIRIIASCEKLRDSAARCAN